MRFNMAGTLCLSGATFFKAGANVSATIKTDTFAVAMINQAEGYLNAISKYDWVANYASLNAITKLILEEACSNLSAIYAIQYDMSGYTTRQEAEDMVDILWARFNQCKDILEKQDFVNYIGV